MPGLYRQLKELVLSMNREVEKLVLSMDRQLEELVLSMNLGNLVTMYFFQSLLKSMSGRFVLK